MTGRPLVAAIAASSLLLAACSGDTDGGGSPPTAPEPAIVLTPDRAAGSPSISLRAGAASTSSVLQLEVVASGLLNVQAIDFVLLYPERILRYDGFTRGAFMGVTAQVITGTGASSQSFQILRTNPGPASGSGVILTLTFSAIAGGAGDFDFLDPVAEDPFGLEIQGIDWIGAAVQVII